MPCDQVRNTRIDLGKINAEILTAALTRLGLQPTQGKQVINNEENTYISFRQGTYANGSLTLYGLNAQERANEIRRAYSGEVIRTQARKYGWTVKEMGKNKLQVIKQTI